jgi:hypothetical protein
MRTLSLVPLMMLYAGCEPEPAPTCPGPSPAFRVQVKAEGGGLLAPDTKIAVRYGGNGEETFQTNAPEPSPQVLFCALIPVGTTADKLEGVSCQLWTDGAAELKIEGTGFETYDRSLGATRGECGIETTLMEILLRPTPTEGTTPP